LKPEHPESDVTGEWDACGVLKRSQEWKRYV